MCPSIFWLQPLRLTLWPVKYLQIFKVLTSTLGSSGSCLGMNSTDFLVTCSFIFHPSGQILDNFPVSYYNSQLYRDLYFQVEFHFMIFCHISNFSVPWCIVSHLITIFKRLPTSQIYPTTKGYCLSPPAPTTSWIKILTWLHFSAIETVLGTNPGQGMAISHCFWM